MADVHPPVVRSYNMSQVRSKNTKPEIFVRKYLFSQGFRYRLHSNSIPGKPDIILRKYKTVIFINGCFWHSHPNCNKSKLPKSNRIWWQEKIGKNVERDLKIKNMLEKSGWLVITLWECELARKANPYLKLEEVKGRIVSRLQQVKVQQ